ncbi:hypothetical protein GGR56DRAFT_692317 [Xylariaceae sp. FL0804]|nr:hypothetical protein GGR56DRAFT_692317 [Xylariaceae sp. FL0804]
MASQTVTEAPYYAEADILGQFAILNAYTQWAFGFELPRDIDRDAVILDLRTTFERLVEQIPWLGWQVATTQSGQRTVIPWPKDTPRESGVRVSICDDLMPPMDQLLAEKVPMKTLDGTILCPWPAIPLPHGITGPLPVLALQANFMRGGLVLTLNTNHAIFDGQANIHFLQLFATLLNGREIAAADLEEANRDRNRIVPLIPQGEPVKDFSYLRLPADGSYSFPRPRSHATAYFLMAADSLSELVETVRREAAGLPDAGTRISTDDILCAFYWKRLCAIRLARDAPRDDESNMARVINGRTPLGISPSFMGNLVTQANVRLPLGRVEELTLPELALRLRRELREAATPWALSSFATFIAREPLRDRRRLTMSGPLNPDNDVMANNVSRLARPSGPWGPRLGPCRFCRRPDGPPLPGMFRVQEPEDGAYPLLLCLAEEEMEALKADELWCRYATFIG